MRGTLQACRFAVTPSNTTVFPRRCPVEPPQIAVPLGIIPSAGFTNVPIEGSQRFVSSTTCHMVKTVIVTTFIGCACALGMARAELARVVALQGELSYLKDDQATLLKTEGLIPMGATVKTGQGSEAVIAMLPECMVTVKGGSEFTVTELAKHGRGKRIDPTPRAVSAMKSVLTHPENEIAVYERVAAKVEVAFRSGSLLSNLGDVDFTIRLEGGEITARGASFAVTAVPSGGVRITVATGVVAVRSGSGTRLKVGPGQFVRSHGAAAGIEFERPEPSEKDPGAAFDLAALQKNSVAYPEPVADGDAVVASMPATPAASAPFDLATRKNKRLLSPPNSANTSGLVQSPEQP